MKLISFSPFLSLLLTPLLVVAPVWAQVPAAPDAESLQLRLVESDSGQVQAGSHAVKGFTVEVKDSDGSVVPDAAVAFRLPDSGATGTFADHTHAAVSYTDSLGRAHVGGIQWSAIPGLVPVRISATKGTTHAGMLIEQALLSSSAKVGPAVAAKITVSPQQPGTLANPTTALSPVPPKEPVVTVTGAPPHSAAVLRASSSDSK